MGQPSKEELIKRWGLDEYNKWAERKAENVRRKWAGLEPLPKYEPRPLVPPDDLTIRMDVNFQHDTEEELNYFAGKIQKELTRWWRTETGQTKFILVAEAVGKINSPLTKLQIDITQLQMPYDLQDKFKWEAPQVVRKYLDTMNK